MKKLILILMIFIYFDHPIHCKNIIWNKIYHDPSIRITSLNCFGDRDCLLSAQKKGWGMILLLSEDSGNSWDVIYDNTKEFTTFSVKDSDILKDWIISASDSGRILNSLNKGIEWDTITINDNSLVKKVEILDSSTALLITTTKPYGFYVTTNKGFNWDFISLPDSIKYDYSIQYFSSNSSSNYFVCTTKDGDFLITTDKSFQQFQVKKCPDFVTSIQFIDNDIGWLSSIEIIGSKHYGSLYKTTNGGKTWDTLLKFEKNNFYDEIRDLSFLNEDNGLILGFGSIYRTYDGGKNWIKDSINKDLPYIFSKIIYLNPTSGLTYANNGALFKFDLTLDIEIENNMTDNILIYPNPNQKGKSLYISSFNESLVNSEIKMIDVFGQNLLNKSSIFHLNDTLIKVSLDDIQFIGTYFIIIEKGQNIYFKKIIINN